MAGGQSRRGGPGPFRPRGVGAAALALVWMALSLGSGPGSAAAALPEGGAVDQARETWMPALLGKSWPERLKVLTEMRADAELARQALLLAVSDPAPLAERWRLLRHLAEFGQTEDIPVLLGLLENSRDPLERRFAAGSARALYPRYEPPADPGRSVADFILLQTRPPQPYDADRAGAWMLTPRMEEEFLRAEVPIDLVVALRTLRDRTYPDRAGLAAAMQKTLPPADWRNWQETLLASLEPLPARVQMDGILRVRVANPLERPLLVEIDFDIWRARFAGEPGRGLLFVKPGEEGRFEVPVRVIAPASPYPVRIDLHLREVHRPPQPLYRKLLIPTQP